MNPTSGTVRAWPIVQFGEVVRQVKDKIAPETAGLERYVAGEHMDTDDLRIRRWGQIGDGYLGPAFHMRFRPGHVLYGSRRTYLRKIAVPDFEGICANTTFVIEPRSAALMPAFLPYVMTTDAFHDYSINRSKGSVNPYVNFSDLTAYEFGLPPPDRQAEIVGLLSDSDNVSEAYRAALGAAETLLAALVTEHYCAAVAEGRLVPITQLGDLTMGRQKAPKYEKGDHPVPYLRVANIGSLEIAFDVLEEMDFTPTEMDRYRLTPGDVLLTEGDIVSARNVGRAAVFTRSDLDCCFQNTLIRLRPKEGIDPIFAMTMVEGARLTGLLAATAKTTTVSHLGLRRLAQIELPLVEERVQALIRAQIENLLAVRRRLRSQVKTSVAVSRGLRNEILK